MCLALACVGMGVALILQLVFSLSFEDRYTISRSRFLEIDSLSLLYDNCIEEHSTRLLYRYGHAKIIILIHSKAFYAAVSTIHIH